MEKIDTSQAARFLAAISTGGLHTFQTLDDAAKGDKSKVRRGFVQIMHGRFENLADRLQSLNLKGAGVFFMVNQGDGKGREKKNVTACRLLFLDQDNSALEPVLAAKIPPDIVTRTSAGKHHSFWNVADMPLDMWPAAQKRLAALFGGDPSVNDINRVARLPGFLHNKNGSVRSELIKCESTTHTWDELVQAFGFEHHYTLPNKVRLGERNPLIFRLAKSARRQGVPFEDQLAKARAVNAARFDPLMDDGELVGIVARVYGGIAEGDLHIPLAVHDDPAYKALSFEAQAIIGLAYRKWSTFNNGNFSLAWSEYKDRFKREESFEKWRAEAAESPFLRVAVKQPKRFKGQSGRPKPNLYALAIPPQSVPYQTGLIPPQSVPPEALQLCAVRASESSVSENGPKWPSAEPANDGERSAPTRGASA